MGVGFLLFLFLVFTGTFWAALISEYLDLTEDGAESVDYVVYSFCAPSVTLYAAALALVVPLPTGQ